MGSDVLEDPLIYEGEDIPHMVGEEVLEEDIFNVTPPPLPPPPPSPAPSPAPLHAIPALSPPHQPNDDWFFNIYGQSSSANEDRPQSPDSTSYGWDLPSPTPPLPTPSSIDAWMDAQDIGYDLVSSSESEMDSTSEYDESEESTSEVESNEEDDITSHTPNGSAPSTQYAFNLTGLTFLGNNTLYNLATINTFGNMRFNLYCDNGYFYFIPF